MSTPSWTWWRDRWAKAGSAAAVGRSLVRRWPWRTALVAGFVLGVLSLAWPLPEAAERPAGVVSVQVTDRHGTLLREIRPEGRGRPVSLADIDPSVRAAVIATEDRRFDHHPGVDPVAIVRAAWSNWTEQRIVSGASTLTMQVARLLRDRTSRGWSDKLAEAHLALRLELRWSKARILETWLNRVSYGNRAHGIEAAARLYFGKTALDLTRAEAAYLVGLPQSPTRHDPFRHPVRARERQQRVLDAMLRTGDLSPADRQRLGTLPLDLQRPDQVFRAPHFTERIRLHPSVDAPASIGASAPDGKPGLVEVRTTLDARLQHTVQGLVRGHVKLLAPDGVSNAAAVVIENATGAVRAYVGSADFWNATTGGQNDGVRMLRQPGSALKPFTYARALDTRRHTAASVLPDVEARIPEAGGAFVPTNYDDAYHGPVPFREALANSYNVPAVRLAQELGTAGLLETLRGAGFSSLDRPPDHYGAGLTLGNGEVRLLDLARAYAGIARGGMLPPLRSISWRRTVGGDTLAAATPRPEPMPLSPAALRLITDILADPEAREDAFGRGGPLDLPFPAAAKTGTSKDYRDNWTIGFTPAHTVAVWVGNFDGSPMRRVSGITGAGPLYRSIMMHLGSGGAFSSPEATGLEGVRVCPASGHRPGAHCSASRREWFMTGTAPGPRDTCRVHRVVAIDTRSGLLADEATPSRHVEHRRYTVHPEIYHPWMRDHGLPLPPRVTHANATAPAAADSAWQATDRLQVLVPAARAQFTVDPILRDAYQQLHLQGTAPDRWHDVHWTVDRERLSGDFREMRWPLSTGVHRISLRALGPDGTRYESRPSTIRVHDVPEAAGWASVEATSGERARSKSSSDR